jgi:hypothetical protein
LAQDIATSCRESIPIVRACRGRPNVQRFPLPGSERRLNQVELWFAKIERDVIARGVFTSVPDLNRKLMRYIGQYNEAPRAVKWKYFDPTRRITSESVVTAH